MLQTVTSHTYLHRAPRWRPLCDRWIATPCVLITALVLLVIITLADWLLAVARGMTFRKFDHFALYAGMVFLAFNFLYLVFMLFAAWCNGTLQEVVR